MTSRSELVPSSSLTLYEFAEDLLALLNSEALVTAEQQAEYQRDLAASLEKTAAKRDAVAAFIKTLELHAKFAGEEIDRIRARKQAFQNSADRLRQYVVDIIDGLGPDAKGKLRKFEGDCFTLQALACPVSLEITEESLVPLEYRRVTVSLREDEWDDLLDVWLTSLGSEFRISPGSVSHSIDNAAIKAYLNGPRIPCGPCNGIGMVERDHKVVQCSTCGGQCSLAPEVPGASLIVGKLSLQVK